MLQQPVGSGWEQLKWEQGGVGPWQWGGGIPGPPVGFREEHRRHRAAPHRGPPAPRSRSPHSVGRRRGRPQWSSLSREGGVAVRTGSLPSPQASRSQSRNSPTSTRLGCSPLGKDSSTSYSVVLAESRPDSGSCQRCSCSCTRASSRGLVARCGSLESSLQGGRERGGSRVRERPLAHGRGAKAGLSPKILPDPIGI